ncbi:thioredoxin fold domain-containing protein [Mangrovimonas sp. YM274]|uniref:thioredoxin family protein n=1 Tax=Mangrovimonas sp. YM274 TaxID=3070660 RepID=UPI0027DE2CAB|nr:thioredoxin fold domain-containing protein [Mangrovimonas sp. YM274]WMI68144.1 thioredoxin family protein [Mangrovimonas sp. YM274]
MSKTNAQLVNSLTNSPKTTKTKSHPFWRLFWLTFLVVSLAYAWYSFYVPSNDVAWADNMVSAKELVNDSDKNMMLFFTGDWCVPCRIMKREVFADKEVSKAINSQVVPVIINVDDPNVEELIKHYKVGTTPITIFTNPQGEVLDYAVGKIGKTEFLEMLKNL